MKRYKIINLFLQWFFIRIVWSVSCEDDTIWVNGHTDVSGNIVEEPKQYISKRIDWYHIVFFVMPLMNWYRGCLKIKGDPIMNKKKLFKTVVNYPPPK